MPIGIPHVIRPNKNVNWTIVEDLPYKGIYKVYVQPPRKLYLPVLPLKVSFILIILVNQIKVKNSLLFGLCRKCMFENVDKSWVREIKCEHSNEQRSFTTICTHPELLRAISEGYIVKKFYEAYYWKEWSKDLFKKYISTNLKVKMESSGIPQGMTDDEKKHFLEKVYELYGFHIDESKWIENKGLRNLSKLFLNTSWGKFAQRDNFVEVHFLKC